MLRVLANPRKRGGECELMLKGWDVVVCCARLIAAMMGIGLGLDLKRICVGCGLWMNDVVQSRYQVCLLGDDLLAINVLMIPKRKLCLENRKARSLRSTPQY